MVKHYDIQLADILLVLLLLAVLLMTSNGSGLGI